MTNAAIANINYCWKIKWSICSYYPQNTLHILSFNFI